MLIIDSLSFGGSQSHVQKLALSLPCEGFDVGICCLEEKGAQGEELERKGVEVTAFGLRKLYGLRSLHAFLMLVRRLKRERVSIVQSFLVSGRIFGSLAARLAGVPVVLCGVRGEAVLFHQRRHRFFIRLANRYVHRFIANSESMKKRLMASEGIGGERIAVVTNGIDLRRFQRSQLSDSFRKELGFSEHEKVVGYMGSLISVKRIDLFLRAAREVAAVHPEAKFLIVGSALPHIDPTMGEKLEALAEELGIASRVIFLGFQSNSPRVYASMDLLVLPSESEGMSNVLLEAMAMSLPVIASDIEANKEVVSEGHNGYLFPVGDHRLLAEKVRTILDDDDLARRFGEASRRIVEESFDQERMVANTVGVYRKALAGSDVVTEYFEKKACEFDAIYSGKKSLPARLLDRLLRWDMFERMKFVIAVASEVEAGSILDVGCGSGRIAVPLAHETSAHIMGIDTSPRMIDMARAAARAAGVLERCTFRVGDIFSLPVEEKFEMVFAIGLFDYIFEPFPILERMALLADGDVVASFPRMNLRAVIRKIRLKICGCPVRFYSRRDVEELFSRAGLEISTFSSVGNLYIVKARAAGSENIGGRADRAANINSHR